MRKLRPLKPTESELEILSILWSKKAASVRVVHEELGQIKDAGYTTTLKLMQIMHEKGLVSRDDGQKTHIYSPAISKENTQKQFLGRMIDSLFAGSPTELVLQALGNTSHSEKELQQIQQLIDDLKKKK